MKFYTKYNLLLLLSLTMINCKTTEKNVTPKKNKIEKKLDSIFSSLSKNGKFNGNVLVAKNDEILYQKGFGFSNGSKQLLLKSTDRFNIGSIYKEIPAIAIMQLKEKGLLKLNASISEYIPNLPKWSNKVSIKNLIQYTSGLPKINWRKHKVINDKALINDLLEISNLEFTPGKSYLYTNYSPLLLSKIVENITGEKFTKYTADNILKPFKLNQSKFSSVFPYQNRESQAISFNSNYTEDNPPFKIESSIFLFSTTTEDLFKLSKELHAYRIINKKSLHIIAKTAVLKVKEMESALGQVEFINNKISKHTHHGSNGNYESILYRNNSKKNTVILLTNNKKGNIHSIKDALQKLLQ